MKRFNLMNAITIVLLTLCSNLSINAQEIKPILNTKSLREDTSTADFDGPYYQKK